MWDHFFGGVCKRSVAIVMVQSVWVLEVVADIDIGPAVFVVVPPCRRVSFAIAFDSGFFTDFGKGAVAIVANQPVRLAHRIMIDCNGAGFRSLSDFGNAVVLLETRHDTRLAIDHPRNRFVHLATRIVVEIRHEVEIKIAVAIVIAKRWCVPRTNIVNAKLFRLFYESTVAVVDEEVVGRIKIADVDIQIAVVVDVHHRRTSTPRVSRI